MLIRTYAALLVLVVGCKSADRQSSKPDDCIDEPAPLAAGERGPFPFETCRARIDDVSPARALDQEATVRRRAAAPKACCYAPASAR